MIAKTVMWSIILSFCSATFADRRLEQDEIRTALKQIVDNRHSTWIPYGTLNASHHEFRSPSMLDSNTVEKQIVEETEKLISEQDHLDPWLQTKKVEAIPFNVRYKLSNEYAMDSNETIKYDGTRFFWLINTLSRTDSVKKSPELNGNFLTVEYDLNRNQKRILCWDGTKYATYFLSDNQAIITRVPCAPNGPLTAGLIAWGKADLSLEKLYSSRLEGFERYIDGHPELHITIVGWPAIRTLTLDPEKQYAVKQFAAVDVNFIMVVQNYEKYQYAGQQWCPTKITLEKYDLINTLPKLVAQDIWNITIDERFPRPDNFTIDYETDANITDYATGPEPVRYRYSVPDKFEDIDGLPF